VAKNRTTLLTFLGIDLGTSEVKTLLTDDESRPIATGSARLAVETPHPHWSEQNPQAWWHATLDAIAQVRAANPVGFSALRGIGLSGQMHGATLLDRFGQVLRPAILWNDTRAFAECVELEALVPESRSITGNLAMPGFTAPKLLWLSKYEPAVFRAKRDWSDRMLSATGLTREHMPRLVEGSAAAAQLNDKLRREWGITSSVLLCGGAGDNAASAIGMGVAEAGSAFLSLGTSGVLFAGTDRFAPNPAQAVHAFCHCLPNRWHQMSVILSAASSLAWLSAVLKKDVAELAGPAEQADARSAPLFLPYLSGERTPHNDANAKGVFWGLTGAHGDAELAYSVMEGVAFAMADGYAALQGAGTTLDTASFIGGGSRSRFWAKLCATATGVAMRRHQGGDVGAALGAARLARLAVTNEDVTQVCTSPATIEICEPDAGQRTVTEERLARYRRLYAAVKDEFAR
jgi:xylulokinase